jgi:hypothetical protein
MKITSYILLTIALLLSISCSAKIETANTSRETSVQSNTNNQTASPDNAEGSAVQTNLGKVSPDAVVKELYDLHKKQKGPFFDTKNRALINKYFEKTLADYIYKDLNSNSDEVGVLDFDVLYNAQDVDIKKFSVSEPKITGEKAEVVASFENYGEKQNITFLLVKSGDSWKISDIKYDSKNTLLGYFKEDAKNKTSNNSDETGNFEGTYQVGDTTCTVKPIKMAFELKWSKGSGTMIFFYDSDAAGGLTYTSEDGGKGKDKFVFDDETLSTGRFIRADGKEMSVKKIK